MCGIVGQFRFDGKAVDASVVARMRDRIRHRGPDAEGLHVRGPIGLGFRRLAIIDLRPEANQPMATPDGRYWIIFNGEIYNYQELREELVATGYPFRSRSDTEVILALYARYGEAAIPRLRGMFAFAIWDAHEHRLLLARDRIGKKPLKYYLGSRGIWFASELKAMFEDPQVPREADFKAIDAYLTFQYVPHPATGFQDIKKLPQGHYLVVERDGGHRLEQYWALDFRTKEQRSEEEWCEHIRGKLSEAVRLRLMSDVPLGAFLSGGIDSSAVVAFMAEHSTQPVKTFSVGFREASFNELPYARIVAERFSTDHHEIIIEPNALDIVPKLAEIYEEPYADSSAVPTYYISEYTRRYVTVALNGDGGDENFAGYPWYPAFGMIAHYQRVPSALRRLAARLVRPLGSSSPFRRRLQILFNDATLPLWQWYAEFLSYFSIMEKRHLYTPAFQTLSSRQQPAEIFAPYFRQPITLLDRLMLTDINRYLTDDLVVKVDLASMAHSLEARSPFLDHEFMEMTARIPDHFKLKGLQKKYLLKRALRPLLPEAILDRRTETSGMSLGARLTERILIRGKKGFGIPIDAWFRGPLRGFARDTLLASQTLDRGLFTRGGIERLLTAHDQGVSHGNRIWALLMLELWFRSYSPNARVA